MHKRGVSFFTTPSKYGIYRNVYSNVLYPESNSSLFWPMKDKTQKEKPKNSMNRLNFFRKI